MPKVSLFKNGKLISAAQFLGQLVVFDRDGEIYLEWDHSNTTRPPDIPTGGIIKFWLLKEVNEYLIRFVPPEWAMTIDSISYKQAVYQDVVLDGRIIELAYQDYRLICDGSDITTNIKNE